MNNSPVILCKVAVELNFEEPCNFPQLYFSYNKKLWKLKPCFVGKAEIIKEAIEVGYTNSFQKLCFLEVPPSLETTSSTELCFAYVTTNAQRKQTNHNAHLLSTFFPQYLEENTGSMNQSELITNYVTTQLYDALSVRHKADTNLASEKIIMPYNFTPKLRLYQERTVRWLLKRENEIEFSDAPYIMMSAIDNETHVLKHKYCLDFKSVYSLPKITLPHGGILADEMGLGKTVELLALVILNNRKNVYNKIPLLKPSVRKRARYCDDNDILFCICNSKLKKGLIQCANCMFWQHINCTNRFAGTSDEAYICPMCWSELLNNELMESKATLIVTPQPIKQQWLDEIRRHTQKSLCVIQYEGLNAGCYVSPFQLANCDIVVSDYTILRREVYHTSNYKSTRTSRRRPQYMHPLSPLLMVKWWRVCLDEAQMVETNTSRLSEMVGLLPAINRWAITGTPIERSIDDLQSLLNFVGFQELYGSQEAWEALANGFLLCKNKEKTALISILQKCMWRTSKSHVINQLDIPPITEATHYIDLSNVELFHYKEQHDKYKFMFSDGIRKYFDDMENVDCVAKISPRVLKTILHPLLKIRQCCTIPVVMSRDSNKGSAQHQSQFMQPKKLLDHLKSLNESECKSELRSWASSYNGIAAMHFATNDYTNAMKYYELVLKLARENNERNISVDSLLQIHAIHNLIEANKLAPTEAQLDDEKIAKYQQQLHVLDFKYLESNTVLLHTAYISYITKYTEYSELVKNSVDTIEFLTFLINKCQQYHNVLLDKLIEDCHGRCIANEKLNAVKTICGVLYIINCWYQKMQKCKMKLCEEIEALETFTKYIFDREKLSLTTENLNFINTVSECHLIQIRETETTSPEVELEKCLLCKIRNTMNEMECFLFAKQLDVDAEFADGSENPSFEIFLMKAIFQFLKGKMEFKDFNKDIDAQLDIIDHLQSICKKQIKYWIEIEYVVKAFDELNMCKMRVTVTDNVSQRSSYRVLRHEIDNILSEQQLNAQEAQLKFARLQGRLKYLSHLENDMEDETCPICQSDSDLRYIVMECGHSMCYSCFHKIRHYNHHSNYTTCPLCRSKSDHLYYSIKKIAINQHNYGIIGDYSSKISYIVQMILKMRYESEDTSIKILIFSQWMSILKSIAVALDKNNVKYRMQLTTKSIEEFKDPNKNITCMLLPYSRGSKGLNLIEATHIFLVEPTLNPGDELQAIGRVHRFGQINATTVHRFIVKHTIEDNIYKLTTSDDNNETLTTHWEFENMTLDSLENLFVLSNPFIK